MEAPVEACSDHFDRLPDALLLLIFNKLLDAKALTRCLVVCKRFSSLVPQTNSLYLSIPPPSSFAHVPTSRLGNGLLVNSFRLFLRKIVGKPLKRFRRLFALKSTSLDKDWTYPYASLGKVLKKFEEIKSMQIEFPFFGSGIGLLEGCDSMVRWKAVFGRELKSCIIVGATSVQRSDGIVSENSFKEARQQAEQDERFLTDEELRLRIIWTVSCLIAASARHHFLKQIVSNHPSLENVVISDGRNQGKLCMGQEELIEMRNSSSLVSSKTSLERTPLPDLSIMLSCVPVLELPGSGYTMKGATLIVIRPVNDGVMRKELSDSELLGMASEFDGDEDQEQAFGETAKEMLKMRKNYVMTMNSF